MKIRIFLGAGGVGKTSVTAASALGTALVQGKHLVLTIDPAQRLRTALKLNAGMASAEKIPLDAYSPKGELWAALLDIRASLDRMVRHDTPAAQAENVLSNPIYELLTSSIGGMQELMAIERIHQAMEDGFESIFLDTAPSRHALEFLDKPEFFVDLVTSPMVQLVGRSYKWWKGSMLEKLSRKAFEVYTHVESLIGVQLTRDVLAFFAAFQKTAEKYAARARKTLDLLRNPEVTRFTIVSVPFQARKDAEYFCDEFARRRFYVDSMVVNRLWPPLPREMPGELPEAVRKSVEWYRAVSAAQLRKRDELVSAFSGRIPSIISVPDFPPDLQGLEALHSMAQSLRVL
ncbi:MAG TPA: ArsA-related P-loop ATPase [Bryobacteraceae bacterium]|nr:ArsA-related P-loop ATPase [Bryobacteraceae bacterium]HXJ42919.1 ArsA-related P-loop ATPase [Bryobacteraceae bacterium]